MVRMPLQIDEQAGDERAEEYVGAAAGDGAVSSRLSEDARDTRGDVRGDDELLRHNITARPIGAAGGGGWVDG